jgi:ABC-type uncharacterized transport system substrate-binding protein
LELRRNQQSSLRQRVDPRGERVQQLVARLRIGAAAARRHAKRMIGAVDDFQGRCAPSAAIRGSKLSERCKRIAAALQKQHRDSHIGQMAAAVALIIARAARHQLPAVVGSGFVAGLPRPGGNVSGFIALEPTISGKWLQLLREIAPRVARVACLYHPTTAPYIDDFVKHFKAGALSFDVAAITAPVHGPSELESVVAAQAREPNSGLLVMPDTFLNVHSADIVSPAARYRLPAVYPFRFFTELGGLLSYGNEPLDNFRRAAVNVDRILRDAKPSELPVQAPVKFELVINLKTAKALGLEVPPTLLARADEVIE